MAITVDWFDVEKSIICLKFNGQWSWEELAAVLRTENEMIKTVNRKVLVIFDMLESSFLPQNVLGNARVVHDLLPSNVELNVLISNNAFVKTMNNIALKAFPKFLEKGSDVTVATWEEALAIIAEKREQRRS